MKGISEGLLREKFLPEGLEAKKLKRYSMQTRFLEEIIDTEINDVVLMNAATPFLLYDQIILVYKFIVSQNFSSRVVKLVK